MIYTMGLTHKFAASHVLEGHPFCGKLHGHSFRLKVVVQGDPQPELFNFVVNYKEFVDRLNNLVGELANRHLNDMMVGTIPSAQGIANWFWERLALFYRLDEVVVWQDELESSIRRE